MNIYIGEVSRELGRLGVGVDVFTRAQGPDCQEVEVLGPNARVIHVQAGPPRYLPKEDVVGHLPEFICNMRDFATHDGGGYDIVHSHYWLSGRVAGYFKSAWHVPMVAMFHTLAELKNQVSTSQDESESSARMAIERLTVATADQVIASTPIDRGHLETYYGADESRIRVVPCGVDLDVFSPGDQAAARARLGCKDGRMILFVGRIQQLKGLDILIRALAELRESMAPAFRLVIVGGRSSVEGDDPEARELRRLRDLAVALDVASLIDWVGAVDHEQLPDFYRAADVTVMPSTYESFGLVAVESMACATPVVAARVGGLKATVVDGVTGYLVEERDPRLYAQRIGLLLRDGARRTRFGSAARARAAQFGWSQVAAQLVELYTSLVQQSLPAPHPALAYSL